MIWLTRERSKAEIFNFDETCYIRQKTPQTNFRAIQSRLKVGGSGGKPPPKSALWAGRQETTHEKNPYNARLYAGSKANHRCTLFLQKKFNVVAKFWKNHPHVKFTHEKKYWKLIQVQMFGGAFMQSNKTYVSYAKFPIVSIVLTILTNFEMSIWSARCRQPALHWKIHKVP